MSESTYRARLQLELEQRKIRNPSYSLRAFARSLGISRTALSDALAGRRHLSPRNLERVARELSLSSDEHKRAVAQSQGWQAKALDQIAFEPLEEDTFRLIADWYHLAILNLARVKKNRADAHWVARRLAISPLEARQAIARLERLGYLSTAGGKLQRLTPSLDTAREIPSVAIRRYHQQNLRLAERSLELDALDRREFTSMTMAIDPAKIEEAKRMIRRFRTRVASYLESEDPSQVYTIAIQLFPVTRNARSS